MQKMQKMQKKFHFEKIDLSKRLLYYYHSKQTKQFIN